MPPVRSPLARWAPIPLGLFLGLVAVELGLRMAGAALLEDRTGRAGAVEGLSIVCLGDSNTFGLFEPADAAYPAQLQALLDEHAVDGPHRVTNLGIPGFTSEQMLQRAPDAIARYEPDLIIALAGINDRWTSAVREASGAWSRPIWQELRVVQLVQVVAQRLRSDTAGSAGSAEIAESAPDKPPDKPPDGAGPHDFETLNTEEVDGIRGLDREGHAFRTVHSVARRVLDADEVGERLRVNFGALQELCGGAGAELWLLTYANGESWLETANEALRACASELDVPLVDCERQLDGALARLGPETLFFPDRHPKRAGYRFVARFVFQRLVELGQIADPGPIEWGDDSDLMVGRLSFQRRSGQPGLLVEDPLGSAGARILLSFAGEGPGVIWHRTDSGLLDDELYQLSSTAPALLVEAVPGEDAFIPLSPLSPVLKAVPPGVVAIRAIYVVPSNSTQSVRHISNLVEVPLAELAPGAGEDGADSGG